jgi:phosphatidylserine/phosphatidylglycerophosphate/cardiolipin synthase-like enzyme
LLRDKSGIDLRILTNDMKSNDELVRYFGRDVVQFEPKRQYNHDKMIIVDRNIMLVGSMNFSQNALDNNREIGIVILDDKIIRSQYRLFGLR